MLASLLVHLLVLFARQIDLSPPPDLQKLEARLLRAAPDAQPGEAPPPAPAMPPPKPAKPRPPKAVPTPEQNLPQLKSPAPPTRAAPEVGAAPPREQISEAVAEAPPPPLPPPPVKKYGGRWPKVGRITFSVTRGEQKFEVGRAVHQWEIGDDGRYHISTTTETTGLAGFVRPVRITQASIGQMTERGFQPETFMVRREGHEGALRADLDWTTMTIRQGGGEQPLLPGTQDQVSVFYQLGYPGYPEATIEVPITTARKLVDYRFEVLGEEFLEMPFGKTWRTLHVRARHEETTEVWLALEYFSLPVKIRHIDRKGDLYDQWAVEVLVAKNAVDRKNP